MGRLSIKSRIAELDDVDITGIVDTNFLRFDSASGKFLDAASAATKEVWYPVVQSGTSQRPYDGRIGVNGEWAVSNVGAAEECAFNFKVPHDFASLTDLVIMVIPDATETITWDAFLAGGADGEDFETIANSVVDGSLAVTLEQITELDISALFTGLLADDFAGINFEPDISNIVVVGLRLRYS